MRGRAAANLLTTRVTKSPYKAVKNVRTKVNNVSGKVTTERSTGNDRHTLKTHHARYFFPGQTGMSN